MTKILERRAKQLEVLIAAAEKAIASKGLSGLKSRELAARIGVANGAVFNLVDDMDELILRVGSRPRCQRRKATAPPRLPSGWCGSRSPIAISPLTISNYGARYSSTGWRRK